MLAFPQRRSRLDCSPSMRGRERFSMAARQIEHPPISRIPAGIQPRNYFLCCSFTENSEIEMLRSLPILYLHVPLSTRYRSPEVPILLMGRKALVNLLPAEALRASGGRVSASLDRASVRRYLAKSLRSFTTSRTKTADARVLDLHRGECGGPPNSIIISRPACHGPSLAA